MEQGYQRLQLWRATEKLPFPITDDKNRDLAIQLDMLDPAENDEKGMLVTAHVVFIFGPDNKLKLCILYPDTTGRNIDEILRRIISFQLTAEKEVTPGEWKNGESMLVLPTIPEEEAKKESFPKGVFSPKSSHLARNTSTTPPAIGSPWSWCWSCPLCTMSRWQLSISVSPQQSIKNILVWSQPRSLGCYTTAY